MPSHYILIDFENVQPSNLQLLQQHPVKLFVFVGENQNKISFDVVSAIQSFGDNAQYIKITGNGPNSLDFHIAFYIGQLSLQDPKSSFYIISKDTGFDPLIKHLRTKKIKVGRALDIEEIPFIKNNPRTMTSKEKITTIIENLSGRGNSKPRKVKTLASTINSLFAKQLEGKEVLGLIKMLEDKKIHPREGKHGGISRAQTVVETWM